MQIRYSELTDAQADKERDFLKAVQVLKDAGIKARYVETFTNEKDIHPGYILVD